MTWVNEFNTTDAGAGPLVFWRTDINKTVSLPQTFGGGAPAPAPAPVPSDGGVSTQPVSGGGSLPSSGTGTTGTGSEGPMIGWFKPTNDPVIQFPNTPNEPALPAGFTPWEGTKPVLKPAPEPGVTGGVTGAQPTTTTSGGGTSGGSSGGSSGGGAAAPYVSPVDATIPAGTTESGALLAALSRLFAPQPVQGGLVPYTYAPGLETPAATAPAGNSKLLWLLLLLLAAAGYYYYKKHKKGKAHAA